MKIAVLSDSHNSIKFAPFLEIAKNYDAIIHCGDGSRDRGDLESLFEKKFYGVKGNCDFSGTEELFFELSGKKILVTHGHLYGVKTDLSRLRYKAEQLNADLVLYGHSHIPSIDFYDGRIFVNPGSLTMPNREYKPTYCEIVINDGKIIPTLKEYKR